MARKLVALLALIALVSLAPAGAAWAEKYELGLQGGDGIPTWRHGYNGNIPWGSGTEFVGGAPIYTASITEASWKIADYANGNFPFFNDSEGFHTDPDANLEGSFTVVFNSTDANPKFFLDGKKISQVPDDIYISSNNIIITYEAKYKYQGPGNYTILKGTITGDGYNYDGTHFTFTAILEDYLGNHQNGGYISSFILEYPSAVPLPAGVWLLGTGLLGLACLGRRWRK